MGRAGRDGLPSECILFYSWADVKARERFLGEIESPELRREKREATVRLFRIADSGACRHRAIVAHFDEEIGDCGTSCDVCTGVTVTDLVAETTAGGRARGAGREPGRRAGRTRGRALGRAATGEDDRSPSDPRFQKLRTLRRRLADEQGVPAYIVFSDQVLWDLLAASPRTLGEMLDVPGVGPAKLERYGPAFLEALADD
jgi:ATP-dependent DNA helicase RecQ